MFNNKLYNLKIKRIYVKAFITFKLTPKITPLSPVSLETIGFMKIPM
jgi:hypothetical protein